MRSRWIVAVALAAGMSVTPAASGDNGKHQEKGHGKGHSKHYSPEQGWDVRDGFEYRTFERDARPPGWSQGKKTGWKNCGMPPGQAKKYGCRSFIYEGRPHYYYQDDVGHIIVRRPMIEIHAGVDIVK